MSLIRKFLENMAPHRNPAAKVVQTEYGPVSEAVRLRVCANMREDPVCKFQVEQLLIRQCGGDSKRGLAEAKARYPEAYEK